MSVWRAWVAERQGCCGGGKPSPRPSPPPRGRGCPLGQVRGQRRAYHQAAGTRAWNCRGRLSNSPTIVLARMNRRLPAAGAAPNSAAYSAVMSAAFATGAGQTPMMRRTNLWDALYFHMLLILLLLLCLL